MKELDEIEEERFQIANQEDEISSLFYKDKLKSKLACELESKLARELESERLELESELAWL